MLLTKILPLALSVLAATAFPSNHPSRDIEGNQDLQSPSPISLALPRNIGPSLTEFLEKRQSTNTTSPPNATVELCTLPNFAGQCYNATWPVNTCVDLRGYAGNTESFIPITKGNECLLMQGKCDATTPYISVSSTSNTGNDLSNTTWIEDSKSYMCFADATAARRFVRVARLRVGMKVEGLEE